MSWFIDVQGKDGDLEQVELPFDNLVDATIYALDLTETLGKIAPPVPGRCVNIKSENGRLELSLAVMRGGLTGEGE